MAKNQMYQRDQALVEEVGELEHGYPPLSDSAAWMRCPGKLRLEKGLPDRSSEAAREGTAAHKLFEIVLDNWTEIPDIGHYRGTEIDGYVMQGDFIRHVGDSVNVVVSLMDHLRAAGKHPVMYTEQRVYLYEVVGVKTMFGTADVIIVTDDEIYIIDLKYGRGNRVEAKDNSQLELYSLGAFAGLNLGQQATIKRVNYAILQPRIPDEQGNIFHPVSLTREELFQRIPVYRAAVAAAMDPEAALLPGEVQCRWCRAKGSCPALMEQTMQRFEVVVPDDVGNQVFAKSQEVADKTTRPVEELTLEQLFVVVDNANLIKGFVDAVIEHVERRMLDGEDMGTISELYKMVRKASRRAWVEKDEDALVATLGRMGLKKRDVTRQAVRTPKQVLDLATQQGFSERKMVNLNKLIDKPDGQPVLAPIADKRAAIKVTAAQMFDKVPVTDQQPTNQPEGETV